MSDIALTLEPFPPRLVGGTPQALPLAEEDREALRRLCAAGRMIRLIDGSYGTAGRKLLTNTVVARLKKRKLAIAGFDKPGSPKEIYPTPRGKQIMAEDADAAAQ